MHSQTHHDFNGGRTLASFGSERLLEYCPDCRGFELTFDSVRIRLSGKSLVRLTRILEELIEARSTSGSGSSEPCFIGIGGATTSLRLRAAELEILHSLLAEGERLVTEEPDQAVTKCSWVH